MAFWNKWFGKSRKTKLAEQRAQLEAERAKRMAEAALVSERDSEAARQAGEKRLRKLGRARGLAGTDMGAAGKALLGS